MSRDYPHLLSPGRIGRLELRNRVVMCPMGSNLADEGGFCGERSQAYFEARAAGGAAMIICGSVSIAWPEGTANPRHLAISDDRYLPGLRRLTGRVHRHGCLIVPQLQHAGLGAVDDSAAGRELLCPSVPGPKVSDMAPDLTAAELGEMTEPYRRETARVHYREATRHDIDALIQRFAEAADRAARAGFDGAEIHAGHGYIISSFLNPAVNRRADRYGGSLENRARLLLETIAAIRARMGRDFPLWCRIDAVEFLTPGGISHEDALALAPMLEKAGVDAIHCSTYGDAGRGVSYSLAHATHHPGHFVPFAAAIRTAVDVPVIVPGRIEPEHGERLIARGEVDFIGMGRKLLADPELPNKLREGRALDIRPCIYCYICISQIFLRRNLKCAVNAATGHESERLITPAPRRRRVVVVGGGPGGLEAARVARIRGHDVVLVERERVLGGTTRFSAISYPPNGRLVDYLERQVRSLGVQLLCGTEATVESIRRLQPDAVIVAVGARREPGAIPGADLPHVFDGDHFRDLLCGRITSELAPKLSARDRTLIRAGSLSGLMRSTRVARIASRAFLPLGKRIVLVGGGLVAIELAEFLAERDRRVTVLEPGETLGKELSLVRRWRHLHDIRRLGVECVTGATVVRIGQRRLTHLTANGQERSIAADNVIIALGTVANPGLADALRSAGIETQAVGDCAGMAYIDGAVHQGFLAGCAL